MEPNEAYRTKYWYITDGKGTLTTWLELTCKLKDMNSTIRIQVWQSNYWRFPQVCKAINLPKWPKSFNTKCKLKIAFLQTDFLITLTFLRWPNLSLKISSCSWYSANVNLENNDKNFRKLFEIIVCLFKEKCQRMLYHMLSLLVKMTKR